MKGTNLSGVVPPHLSQHQKEVVEGFVKSIGVTKKSPTKNKTSPIDVTANRDYSVLRIIRSSFAELSLRGKGLCLEQLVREYTQEANYGAD